MPRILLALALGVLLSEMKLSSEARTPPYGVKLCGREFIRAVIFTCGGSRWRRAGNVGALPGGDSAEAFAATSSSNEWDPIYAPPKDLADYYGSWRSQQGHSPSEETWGFERGARDVIAGLGNACSAVEKPKVCFPGSITSVGYHVYLLSQGTKELSQMVLIRKA